MIKKKYELFFLFLLVTLVLLLRVNVESTNYCTPDSKYYLEVSKNILDGEGFVGPKVLEFDSEHNRLITLYDKTPFGRPDLYEKTYFAVWPLGYPIGIVSVALITNLEPLWASKGFNILLLALDFYLLFLLLKEKTSNMPMYYFCSYTMLEISSYTWSENLFIPFFLLLLLSIKMVHQSLIFKWNFVLLLSIALIGMCLARYASVIFYITTFVVLLYYLRRKEFQKVKSLFWGLAVSTILFILYLYNNLIQSGYITGMPRSNTQEYTALQLTNKFFMGLFNQLHLIKQFRIGGTADLFFYLLLLIIQLSVMIYLFNKLKRNSIPVFTSLNLKMMFFFGCTYLIFLTYMTFTSVIDPFDYRTLLPFSFPVCMALLIGLDEKLIANDHYKSILIVKLFFLFSLVMNLPKHYILGVLF